jgi:hypothetical protein
MKTKIYLFVNLLIIICLLGNSIYSQQIYNKFQKFIENRNGKEIVEVIRIDSNYHEIYKISLEQSRKNKPITKSESPSQLLNIAILDDNYLNELLNNNYKDIEFYNVLGKRILIIKCAEIIDTDNLFYNFEKGIYFVLFKGSNSNVFLKYYKN